MIKTFKLIVLVLLIVGAIGVDNYTYYQLLRIVVCGYAIWGSIILYNNNQKDWKFITLIVLGILFNPFSPIYLSREIWIPIDILSSILIASINLNKK